MATDVQADIAKMTQYTGYLNSFFFTEWSKFADPNSWDGQSCSEIACCISNMAGNISKIFVSNYAQGIYDQYAAVGRADTTPRPGDFVIFGYGGVPDHTGRVMTVSASTIHTFEGNVGGRTVQRDWALTDPYIFRYCHPYFTNEDMETYYIRENSPEDENLPEYNIIASGGWNPNRQGAGPMDGADALNNCYGYSQGRMVEMYNNMFPATPITSASNQFAVFDREYSAETGVDWFTWEHGGLAYNNGYSSTNQAYIRTPFIYCCKGSVIDVDNGYKFTLCLYSAPNNTSYISGKSATVPGPYTMPQDGYIKVAIANTNNQTQTDFSIRTHLDWHLIQTPDWIAIAQANGFSTGTVPQIGAVGVWCNGTACHTANIEYMQENIYYVSQSRYDADIWELAELGAAPDYLLPFMDNTWTLTGFIYPFNLPYPPPGPLPPAPIPGGENYRPYWRHQRRGRG